MNLFERKKFTSHSGLDLNWKIEADALNDEDIETLAYIVSTKIKFGAIHGIPTGGIRLARALEKYKAEEASHILLIVDDVLTTGYSMNEARERFKLHNLVVGVVIFARSICPNWVHPIFQLEYTFQEYDKH